MARDYKKEYEKSKGNTVKDIALATRIPKTLNKDFTAKVELAGSTKSAKIKELITNYTYGDNSNKSDT